MRLKVGACRQDVDFEARISRKCRLERIEGGWLRELDRHRCRTAATTIGGPHDFEVAPQIGVVGIVRLEFADHAPRLAVQLERRADVDTRELLARTLADDQLAQAGGKFAPIDNVQAGPQFRRRALTDPSHLDVRVEPGTAFGQRRHNHQFSRCDRLPVAVVAYLWLLRDQGHGLMIDHGVHFRLGPPRSTMAVSLIPALLEGCRETRRHRQQRHQHADHAGNSDHHDR